MQTLAHFMRIIVGLAFLAFLTTIARAAEDLSDTLAQIVLGKAGVRATVCEMPRAGDGTLAAALAKAGVAQVHALVADAKAAEAARQAAVAAGVMGSQVIIETGKPDALPLGDWVADLYLVADATDANLKALSAAEAGRVLSPYRGVAVVGNTAGAQGGLSKAALTDWAKGIGGGVGDAHTGRQVMPFIDKGPCGQAPFVADGVLVHFPNVCNCGNVWGGLFVVRPAPARPLREGTRLEQGDASAPAETPADPRDWPACRADETRKGSCAAEIPATAGICWIYTPPKPTGGHAAALPLHLQQDLYATPSVAVGSDVYFGTVEGAVVCLDRASGVERWRYWTAGAIRAAPTWALGRLYAGSSDGWIYCLNAASGRLCWRYRMAPEERRLALMGGLGSAWPVWSSVLVHDGVAYVAAGLKGKLDGSTLCALDARSGAVKWRKDFQSNGETDAQGLLVNPGPAGGGALAWYDGKLWWHGGEWGPAVVDPASGALKRAIDYRPCRKFDDGNNTDIGVLPGGWVAFGGARIMPGLKPALGGAYGTTALYLRTGPDGLPAGDPANLVLQDTATVPHLLKLIGATEAGTAASRQIPVWDDHDALLPGDFIAYHGKNHAPLFCRNLAAWLNAQDDAHPWTVDEANKKQFGLMQDLEHVAAITDLPTDQQHPALPDDLAAAVNSRQFKMSGMMALAKNAAVFVVAMHEGDVYDCDHWRVIAVNRADHAKLWEVALPSVLPRRGGGMSLTRGGDVLIPLEDGRIVCVGAGAREQPLPAVAVAEAKPGLAAADYDCDWGEAGYRRNWNQTDFDILKPAQTRVLAEFHFKDGKKTPHNVMHAWGYIDVPTTGRYRFCVRAPYGSFTLYDRTRQFVACSFGISPFDPTSDEVFLEQGKHPVDLVFLADRMGMMRWEGPGIPRGEIPAAALSHQPEPRK